MECWRYWKVCEVEKSACNHFSANLRSYSYCWMI
eukprot:UN20876